MFSSYNVSFQKITFVDFIMYELLDQHRMFHPTCLDDFKNLKDLLDRFEVRTLNILSDTHRTSSSVLL